MRNTGPQNLDSRSADTSSTETYSDIEIITQHLNSLNEAIEDRRKKHVLLSRHTNQSSDTIMKDLVTKKATTQTHTIIEYANIIYAETESLVQNATHNEILSSDFITLIQTAVETFNTLNNDPFKNAHAFSLKRPMVELLFKYQAIIKNTEASVHNFVNEQNTIFLAADTMTNRAGENAADTLKTSIEQLMPLKDLLDNDLSQFVTPDASNKLTSELSMLYDFFFMLSEIDMHTFLGDTEQTNEHLGNIKTTLTEIFHTHENEILHWTVPVLNHGDREDYVTLHEISQEMRTYVDEITALHSTITPELTAKNRLQAVEDLASTAAQYIEKRQHFVSVQDSLNAENRTGNAHLQRLLTTLEENIINEADTLLISIFKDFYNETNSLLKTNVNPILNKILPFDADFSIENDTRVPYQARLDFVSVINTVLINLQYLKTLKQYSTTNPFNNYLNSIDPEKSLSYVNALEKIENLLAAALRDFATTHNAEHENPADQISPRLVDSLPTLQDAFKASPETLFNHYMSQLSKAVKRIEDQIENQKESDKVTLNEKQFSLKDKKQFLLDRIHDVHKFLINNNNTPLPNLTPLHRSTDEEITDMATSIRTYSDESFNPDYNAYLLKIQNPSTLYAIFKRFSKINKFFTDNAHSEKEDDGMGLSADNPRTNKGKEAENSSDDEPAVAEPADNTNTGATVETRVVEPAAVPESAGNTNTGETVETRAAEEDGTMGPMTLSADQSSADNGKKAANVSDNQGASAAETQNTVPATHTDTPQTEPAVAESADNTDTGATVDQARVGTMGPMTRSADQKRADNGKKAANVSDNQDASAAETQNTVPATHTNTPQTEPAVAESTNNTDTGETVDEARVAEKGGAKSSTDNGQKAATGRDTQGASVAEPAGNTKANQRSKKNSQSITARGTAAFFPNTTKSAKPAKSAKSAKLPSSPPLEGTLFTGSRAPADTQPHSNSDDDLNNSLEMMLSRHQQLQQQLQQQKQEEQQGPADSFGPGA